MSLAVNVTSAETGHWKRLVVYSLTPARSTNILKVMNFVTAAIISHTISNVLLVTGS